MNLNSLASQELYSYQGAEEYFIMEFTEDGVCENMFSSQYQSKV